MNTINRNKIFAAFGLLFFLALFLHSLGDILTPFVVAAFLAYLGDPLVDRLQKLQWGRTPSVVVVFSLLILLLIALLLFFGPLLGEQLRQFIQKLPSWTEQFIDVLATFLKKWGLWQQSDLSQVTIKDAVANYWQQGGNLALNALKKLGSSGAAFIGIITNIVLIPVLTFYLLRDWDTIVDKLYALLPRSYEKMVVSLTKECDEVLSAFLRGQLIVMLSLSVIYSLGLSVVGLDLALLIGTIAGLASIVPYMGFVVGIVAALFAAWAQFHDWMPLLYVGIVFSIGQTLEGMLLTPNLVGNKIGLHPVAVIFALVAGAHLGGFVGLLLALPIAAVLMVLVRYLVKHYKQSYLYNEGREGLAVLNEEASTVAEIQLPVKKDSDIKGRDLEGSVFDKSI